MSFFYRFLKKIRLVVNPTLIESEIWTGSYRHPSPASQIPVKTKQKLPKLTNKYYFERDHRRNYPQTVTYTNSFNLPAPESPQTNSFASCIPPSLHTHHWKEANDSNFPASHQTYFPIKTLK